MVDLHKSELKALVAEPEPLIDLGFNHVYDFICREWFTQIRSKLAFYGDLLIASQKCALEQNLLRKTTTHIDIFRIHDQEMRDAQYLVSKSFVKLAFYHDAQTTLRHRYKMNLGQYDMSEAPADRKEEIKSARSYWIWRRFGEITE
jgi:hypothetical protein